MSLIDYTITPDDKKAIQGNYMRKEVTDILNTIEVHKDLEVGSIVFIKYRETSWRKAGYTETGGKKDKYLIIHRDSNGLVFAKRIISTGKPGKAVKCLTLDYRDSGYTIELDGGMIDAMLLDTEYDPLQDEKAYQKLKAKASRINKKNRIQDSYYDINSYFSTLKIGDIVYESSYLYGGNIKEHRITNIETKTMKELRTSKSWQDSGLYRELAGHGFAEDELIYLLECNSGRIGSNRTYQSTLRHGAMVNHYYYYYKTKPATPGVFK